MHLYAYRKLSAPRRMCQISNSTHPEQQTLNTSVPLERMSNLKKYVAQNVLASHTYDHSLIMCFTSYLRLLRIGRDSCPGKHLWKHLGNFHCLSMTNCDDITYKNPVYISTVKSVNFRLLQAHNTGNIATNILFCLLWKPKPRWLLDIEKKLWLSCWVK